MWAHPRFRLTRVLLRGLPLGLLCAAVTIAFETKYGIYDHHHDDSHGHH